MLAYLIEDDVLKAEALHAFLVQEVPHCCLHTFGSFQSGLKAIQRVRPELILLDMTLPTFDRKALQREGRARPLGGYELLRKMHLHGLRSKVIVVTQLENFGDGDDLVTFDEISAQCAREFPDVFLGSVQFRQSESDWQQGLKTLLSRVI